MIRFADHAAPRSRRNRWLWGSVALALLFVGGAGYVLTSVLFPSSPPIPTISSAPDIMSPSTTATFRYADADSGITYRCGLDRQPLITCPDAGVTYFDLTSGSHTFRVEAVSDAGLSSPAAWYDWTVIAAGGVTSPSVVVPGGTLPAGTVSTSPVPGPATGRPGRGARVVGPILPLPTVTVPPAAPATLTFRIGGPESSAPLHPGTTTALDTYVDNPNDDAIRVTTMTVRIVGTSRPDCPVEGNFAVVHGFRGAITVGPHSRLSLGDAGVPARDWPTLSMADTGADQDRCQGIEVDLAYEGSS